MFGEMREPVMSPRVLREGVSVTIEAEHHDAEPGDPEWNPHIQEVVFTGNVTITIRGKGKYVQALWEAMEPTWEAIQKECQP